MTKKADLPILSKTELKNAVKHLEGGRKILSDKNAWIKGELEFEGAVCSIGALNKAARLSQGYNNLPAERFLACSIKSNWFKRGTVPADPMDIYDVITTFQDSSRTTHASLLRKWDKAIVLARAALKQAEKTSTKKP